MLLVLLLLPLANHPALSRPYTFLSDPISSSSTLSSFRHTAHKCFSSRIARSLSCVDVRLFFFYHSGEKKRSDAAAATAVVFLRGPAVGHVESPSLVLECVRASVCTAAAAALTRASSVCVVVCVRACVLCRQRVSGRVVCSRALSGIDRARSPRLSR